MSTKAAAKKPEAEPDHWNVPEALQEEAVEIARQFRKEPTRGEAVLWQALRARKLDGWKFRRQQPMGPFILDFFCPAARLIVEVDGPIHESQREADENRQQLLQSLGLRFVRVSALEVENDLPAVLSTIRAALAECRRCGKSVPTPTDVRNPPSPPCGRRG